MIQAVETSFLLKVAGLCLRDKLRNSVIWEGLRVQLLLLYIERSQLRWFPPGVEPGHAAENTSLSWPGNASVFPPDKLEEMAVESEVWASYHV